MGWMEMGLDFAMVMAMVLLQLLMVEVQEVCWLWESDVRCLFPSSQARKVRSRSFKIGRSFLVKRRLSDAVQIGHQCYNKCPPLTLTTTSQ